MNTFDGIPAHPLLTHFVVVLIPLGALALVVSVVWPAMRKRLGVITPLISLAAVVLIPVTQEAGEWLEEKSVETALIEKHTELGDQLLFWTLPMLVFATVWWLLNLPAVRAKLPARLTVSKAITVVLAVLSIGSAVAASWEVYLVGHSGAEAVWSGKTDSSAE